MIINLVKTYSYLQIVINLKILIAAQMKRVHETVFRKGVFSSLVILMVGVIFLIEGQANWADLVDVRMGQTSIYDNAYIPLNQISQVSITYKTPISTSSIPNNVALKKGVVLSGFENHVGFQIIMSVTIYGVHQSHLVLDIKVGPKTYVKQMNVNYFLILDNDIQVSTGNYRTSQLDNGSGTRQQQFAVQTTSYVAAHVFSAISGLVYYNSDGVSNYLDVKTSIQSGSPSIIRQLVTIGQKGKLNYLNITMILIAGPYFVPNNYLKIGYTYQTTITQTQGFDEFDRISASGLIGMTDNSLIFGIKGFNFTMEESRVFLLQVPQIISFQITNVTNFRQNLETNPAMLLVKLDVMVLVQRTCNLTEPFYYVQGLKCVLETDCANLSKNTTYSFCLKCSNLCDNCSMYIDDCVACKAGNNRVLFTNASKKNCVCDQTNGYVDVGNDVCQKCSKYIPGCVKCKNITDCEDCGNTTLFQPVVPYADVNTTCRCKAGKFLVTGYCLDKPGCLVGSEYINAVFCQICDDNNNFELDLAGNSNCKCKTAYLLNTTSNRQCYDKCGDGQTPDSPSNASKYVGVICDDGNTISGDGCSSTCFQEYGFLCTVENSGGISKCTLQQQIKITYLYTQKILAANQAVMVFSLVPPQQFLLQSAFQNSVLFNIPQANKNRKVRFDPKTSLIYITIDMPTDLQGKQYEFTFIFNGLKIYSPDIKFKATLNGLNAKLKASENPQMNSIITYVALALSAFALVFALVVAVLGQKMIGIQLILPIQASFFSMTTLPVNIPSPISSLWSMKYSCGYNSLAAYDLSTNYMLDSRIASMQYAGEYILNYNIMYAPLAMVIFITTVIAGRIAWLQRQQKKLQKLQKKKQDQQKLQPPTKNKQTLKAKQKKRDQSSQRQDDPKDFQAQTQQQTHRQPHQANLENLQEQLEDVRENIKNWANFLNMIFDKFFTILIVTAMMKVIFCFFMQVSNFTYLTKIYDKSLNGAFFFVTYATIFIGLYMIIHDYKFDKAIVFACNKGKYAIIYIWIFLVYIITLGISFQTTFGIYFSLLFSLMPIVLIPYQIPYGLRVFEFQNIVAVICQLPFITSVVISLLLNLQGDSIDESTSLIFAYAILGTTGLSIILAIFRLIKILDCKKVTCVQFTDRKKENVNDKNKNKKKKRIFYMDLDEKKFEDQFSQDSVRAVLFQRKQIQKDDGFNIQIKNKQGYQVQAKKNQLRKQEKKNKNDEEDDDEDIDQLEKIKLKLRKDLMAKKATGKVK